MKKLLLLGNNVMLALLLFFLSDRVTPTLQDVCLEIPAFLENKQIVMMQNHDLQGVYRLIGSNAWHLSGFTIGINNQVSLEQDLASELTISGGTVVLSPQVLLHCAGRLILHDVEIVLTDGWHYFPALQVCCLGKVTVRSCLSEQYFSLDGWFIQDFAYLKLVDLAVTLACPSADVGIGNEVTIVCDNSSITLLDSFVWPGKSCLRIKGFVELKSVHPQCRLIFPDDARLAISQGSTLNVFSELELA